ncbi:MAG TPA: SpoIIE family protein phosphatase, partial [Acidimicrobiales bacterium]|nr:SpoIIE family protein phosphatase [Acidimicrobiales bacterium]
QFVRVAGEVEARTELAREVELAAAVQTAFVPGAEPIHTPSARVMGSWQPTSRCGGDWWGCYALPDGRALVIIGDVTGSGVAAAMVTAAAKGACDVAVRIMGAGFDLGALLVHLDGAVRRVGAGRFHLTCFAAIIDAARGEVQFANAGHVVPYVCRPLPDARGGEITLSALVARGNPLGAGTAPVTRTTYVWPARHQASSRSAAALPPMGTWFRLKADVDVSRFTGEVRAVLEALKVHGMILADNGSPWYLSGVPNGNWDNDALRALGQLRGADFEAVDSSCLQVAPNSGRVRSTLPARCQ